MGNRRETAFWVKVIPVRFRNRDIRLTDSLMNEVMPEILERTSDVARQETVLETFLEINGPLRESSHRRFEEISRQSAGRLLWSQPFLQLSNSQVEFCFCRPPIVLLPGAKRWTSRLIWDLT